MKILEPIERPSLTYIRYDERYPSVFEKLKSEIAGLTDVFEIEHIGSTAVPGCSGKGIIDVMALYPAEALEETKEILLSMGFCKQGEEFPKPFPEYRPMYLGKYNYKGEGFIIYVHVVNKDSDEVRRFCVFRDRLRETPELLREYCDVKQSILSDGVRDSNEYLKKKTSIIKKILGADYRINKLSEN